MRMPDLRNVPDEVIERLERLAAQSATSVSAVAIRELAEVSRRADNRLLDSCYVALAELLGCTLIMADGKLSRAPKLRCSVTVVPR